MARSTAAKRLELESFWRSHLEGWRRSLLNQREYCELHGLPLKRFGNWRAKFKHEDDVPRRKLLWRRGGGLRHMSRHMSNKETLLAPATYIPSASAIRRQRSTSTVPTARRSGQPLTLRASRASCRSTAMPGLRRSRKAERSSWRPAGRTADASSMSSIRQPARRSPPRPCAGSPSSMPSRNASAASPPKHASGSGRPSHGRSSRP